MNEEQNTETESQIDSQSDPQTESQTQTEETQKDINNSGTEPNTKSNTESDSNTILKNRLNDLQKQKRENEYFIRVSKQAIKFRIHELNREIRKRYDAIKKFRSKKHKTGDDQIEPVDTLRKEITALKERLNNEIEDIEFKIREKEIENEEIDNMMRNNWGPANTKTVTKWIKESNMQNFVYERVREVMQRRFRRLTMAIFILSGIGSLMNMSTFGVTDEDYPTAALVMKIIATIISLMIVIISKYISEKKFEDIIQSYTSYIERLENFLSNLVSTADVKPELRPDGDLFVLENREMYAGIYRDSPYISKRNWDRGVTDYKEYVLNADPEKELYCSRKRANYAYFARQESEDDLSLERYVDRKNPPTMMERRTDPRKDINNSTIESLDTIPLREISETESETEIETESKTGSENDDPIAIKTSTRNDKKHRAKNKTHKSKSGDKRSKKDKE